MFKTIFQRLFWTSTAIIFFVVAAVSASMFVLLNRYILNEKLNSAKKASQSIEYLTTAIASGDVDSRYRMFYDQTLSSWSLMIDADITVVNQSGTTFAATNRNRRVPAESSMRIMSGETIMGHVGGRDNVPSYIVGIPIHYQDKIIGGMFYFYPPGIMKGTVLEFSYMIFISLMVAMTIAMCLVYFESRRISGPLKEINNAVLEIASGKFDKRVSIKNGDEIAQLASSFNYMADSLKHVEEMRASFISDISHELRTPMTSISGFVEGILDGTIPKEKEREYLSIVLEESTRLARLTNEMFEMTKMTSPEYKLTLSKFDFIEAVRLCIISAEQKIDNKNLHLDVWFENEAINVIANPDAIKRVIINLLDNAIKFSYDGQTITIRVFERGKQVVFEIINYGIGINEEDIPHIFDRFYKTDKSRSRDRTGAGLGLSFVKKILNLHCQQINVTSVRCDDNTKKTTFTFTLEKA